VEKTSVGGVMGFPKKRIVPIHHRPQLPTLTQTSHVPIVMYMSMMLITASYFTQNYDKVNHRTLMLIRAKVLGKARKGKVLPTKV